MKKNIVILMAMFSLVFVGCSNKSDNPGKTYKGRNNMTTNGIGSSSQGQVAGATWDNFANSPISLINASAAQLNDFISQSYSGTMGSLYGGTVEMQLFFNGSTVMSSNSRLGIMIWDDLALQYVQPPFSAYEGPEVSGISISGQRNGNQISATFEDAYGAITVDGYINGSTFSGQIGYNNGSSLGSFSLPTQGVIF